MLVLNGAAGEGGGQILRTSLGLSLATGQPFRIEQIRANRKSPGLLRQHLTAVRAAAAVGQARVTGDELGSSNLTFTPGAVKPGEYTFSVGTAGSTTLVLQTVLPALLLADGPSRLVLEGGTHNTHSPPYDFLVKAFLPLVNRMGVQVTTKLERYGFYPAGGGRFVCEITPAAKLLPVELIERGERQGQFAKALVANLRKDIGLREVATAVELLNWPVEHRRVEMVRDSVGPGNVLLLEAQYEHVTEVFSGFGRLGVSAEAVAGEAVQEAREYLASDGFAGEHLADQLLVPMALAGAGAFTATKLTLHATTNIETIRQFLPVPIRTEQADGHWLVMVGVLSTAAKLV